MLKKAAQAIAITLLAAVALHQLKKHTKGVVDDE